MTPRSAAAAVLLLVSAGVARAHETWWNGAPIPDWVRRECCGPADAHHLRPDEVHPQRGGGFAVDGLTEEIPFWLVLPSQDGEYWAFYAHTDRQQFLRCFFAPKPSS